MRNGLYTDPPLKSLKAHVVRASNWFGCGTAMRALILIGLIVLVIGKLKLTPTIALEGVRARWYGLALVVTAFPFQWLVQQGFLALPSQIAQNRIWGMVISILAVIGYVVLLALPFRARRT